MKFRYQCHLIGYGGGCTATPRQQNVMLQFSIWQAPAMTTRFLSYSRTARGQRLTAIIQTPERYPEYRAFSREGFPAVTALVSLLRAELEPLRLADRRAFDAAKQFVGSVMRYHRHAIIGRSRVPGGLFTVGAIWSGEPIDS
jgi:hypothetical protein